MNTRPVQQQYEMRELRRMQMRRQVSAAIAKPELRQWAYQQTNWESALKDGARYEAAMMPKPEAASPVLWQVATLLGAAGVVL